MNIVKPPKVKTIPDILTPGEVEHLIGATRKLRYRVFLLTNYSMGLRLAEGKGAEGKGSNLDYSIMRRLGYDRCG